MHKDQRKPTVFSYNPSTVVLDDVNAQILSVLCDNPRLTMAELGRRVGMSSPAVTERVRRLEEAGVIRGYQLDINPVALGLPLTAFIRIQPNSGQLARVVELARSIPEITECHRITGEDCFILKPHLPEMEQLDRVLDRFLTYGTTTTSIVQSTPVPLRSPPLPRPPEQ
ncbi:MAG: Lrp/AsnC family transcriptional regulator [Chloroflexota bacterium]|nr:Lrp/AsnC family transcriptional regulator [Chloroflexota bacterium]